MSGPQGQKDENVENFLIVVLLAVLGAGLVMWLAGQIAARVFEGAWPPVSFGEVPLVAFSILMNLGDPKMAWPAEVRSDMTGPIPYYLTLLALIGALAGLAYLAWETIQGVTDGRSGLGNEKTRWAKGKHLRTLMVNRPQRGRLVLGRVHGRLVAAETRQSVIVMGPTQSGKTSGLAVPAILEWQGPIVATSVKADLARDTLAWRERQGRVWIYDPTESTGLPVSSWSPLDGSRDWEGAKKIANWLVSASQPDKSNLQDAQFWYTAAGKLLAPHLFAAAANGYTMEDVVRWIDTQEDFEVRALLQATQEQKAIDAFEANMIREERARSSIYTTAEVVIEAYSDPTVLLSSRTSEIRAPRLLDGGNHTLYVCAPGHEQARLRPVFSTLLKQIITASYERAGSGGRPLDPPLLIVLDEAANIAPLADLDSIASTAAGHGIQLLTVWQDLSQINARYGERASTVVNNHRAKIVLSGISDPQTLDYASRLIGSEEVRQTSYTRDPQGQRSRTISKQDKNLAPSDVLRRIRPNEGVLVYGSLLPSRIQLRPWFKSKELRARSEGRTGGAVHVEELVDQPHLDYELPGLRYRQRVGADSGGGESGSDFASGGYSAASTGGASFADTDYRDLFDDLPPYGEGNGDGAEGGTGDYKTDDWPSSDWSESDWSTRE